MGGTTRVSLQWTAVVKWGAVPEFRVVSDGILGRGIWWWLSEWLGIRKDERTQLLSKGWGAEDERQGPGRPCWNSQNLSYLV